MTVAAVFIASEESAIIPDVGVDMLGLFVCLFVCLFVFSLLIPRSVPQQREMANWTF